jgi:hypothetical protein
MKVETSPQRGQVALEAVARDVLLLAETVTGTHVVATVIEEVNAFQTELADRATRQTRVLVEILNRDRSRTA